MAATVTGVLLTGIHSARPSSGVSAGTLYSCTTHSLIYQTSDTGTTWTTWATLGTVGGSGTVTTVEEVDGSPTDSAVTKIVFPNGSLGITSHVATYTPVALASASYKRSSGDYALSAVTTFTDIDGTNMNLTITTGARRVLLCFTGGTFPAADDTFMLDFTIDGTRQGGDFGIFASKVLSGTYLGLSVVWPSDALSAGSHTFKVQYRSAVPTTWTLGGSTTSKPQSKFAVVELPG